MQRVRHFSTSGAVCPYLPLTAAALFATALLLAARLDARFGVVALTVLTQQAEVHVLAVRADVAVVNQEAGFAAFEVEQELGDRGVGDAEEAGAQAGISGV